MRKKPFGNKWAPAVLAGAIVSLLAGGVQADDALPVTAEVAGAAAGLAGTGINGLAGGNYSFWAKADQITTPDGGVLNFWGLATCATCRPQYPAPTLILDQGQTVTVTLANQLPQWNGQGDINTSLVFPGHKVSAAGGVAGALTKEAAAKGNPANKTVTYTFTADHPGTYMYHSGTDPKLQVEMGIAGAIIVRPSSYPAQTRAYASADSAYDREYLFFLTEMDPRIHDAVELGGPAALAGTNYLSNYFPTYWFINGRAAPDTMQEAGVNWLPTQPYDALALMQPGEKVLMRVVGAGRQLHPFHHHGNHARIIARDGRLLSSTGTGADLSVEVFTTTSVPGQTTDAIFEWTGKDLGWDIYGGTDVWGTMPELQHTCNGQAGPSPGIDPVSHEYCPDHGKPLPVQLPANLDLAFGGFWSGSPYLGSMGSLPPGEGGLNPWGGFTFMWHSHTEKELTNDDLYPGGILTMMFVVPNGTL